MSFTNLASCWYLLISIFQSLGYTLRNLVNIQIVSDEAEITSNKFPDDAGAVGSSNSHSA